MVYKVYQHSQEISNEQNFKKKGIKRTKEMVEALKSICKNLLRVKSGKLLVTYSRNKPLVASFFVYDRFRAYHLFVGTDLKYKDLGVGTKNLHDSCIYLNKELNIKELDMVGINSPYRGSYKLTYGGRIMPYYQITKVLPRKRKKK